MFYVYLLHSTKDNGFYIGFSTDLKRRLSEHRLGASFATKSRGPWKLIYYEAYTEREDAEDRERFLKSGAGRQSLAVPAALLPKQIRRQNGADVQLCGERSGTSHVRRSLLRGYPAWIRTMNNASKGRCVTVTPRGKSRCRFAFAVFDGGGRRSHC